MTTKKPVEILKDLGKGMQKKRQKVTNTSWFFSIRQFRKGQWSQFRMMSFVFAILLLFLHIFVVAAKLTDNAANWVKEKLGVYLYIKDATQIGSGVTDEQLAGRLIAFKSKLEDWGAKVSYYSKEDALKNLQNRLPSMVQNFQEYGIDNPLPATMYVMFDNQKEYDYVMGVKGEYEDMLLKWPANDSQEQFTRNARLINLLQVLQYFFLFIIVACVVVVLVFLGMIIKTKFAAMHHSITVQKLLGAPFGVLKKPFFTNSVLVLTAAYILTAIFSVILLSNISSLFPYLFGVELKQFVWWENTNQIARLFVEFVVLMVIAIAYANWQLTKLLKKD